MTDLLRGDVFTNTVNVMLSRSINVYSDVDFFFFYLMHVMFIIVLAKIEPVCEYPVELVCE